MVTIQINKAILAPQQLSDWVAHPIPNWDGFELAIRYASQLKGYLAGPLRALFGNGGVIPIDELFPHFKKVVDSQEQDVSHFPQALIRIMFCRIIKKSSEI